MNFFIFRITFSKRTTIRKVKTIFLNHLIFLLYFDEQTREFGPKSGVPSNSLTISYMGASFSPSYKLFAIIDYDAISATKIFLPNLFNLFAFIPTLSIVIPEGYPPN